MAIAAAVLGGTSLFGGRGTIFPGTILGAVILQCVENGLVLMQADPYLFPIVTSSIIFVAVMLDGGRHALLESLQRRPIFIRDRTPASATLENDRTCREMSEAWQTAFDGNFCDSSGSKRFQVGDLVFDYSQGSLRYLSWRSHEIVRRIYFALRDENWGTRDLVVTDEQIRQDDDQVEIQFTALCPEPSYRLEWQGKISVSAGGSMVFSVQALADVDMNVNRVGLCLLHPPQSMVGREVNVVNTAGETFQIPVQHHIHPENFATNIQAMHFSLDDGTHCQFDFAGEAFEIEDQRNWIDDSFKTFCRPLAKPRPFLLHLGEQVEQHISLTVRPSIVTSAANMRQSYYDADIVQLRIQPDRNMTLKHPAGIGWTEQNMLVPEADLERMRQVRPGFMRLDYALGNDDWSTRLAWARQVQQKLACGIELALSCNPEFLSDLPDFLSDLIESGLQLDRILLLSANEWTTSHEMIEQACNWRRAKGNVPQLYAGTKLTLRN